MTSRTLKTININEFNKKYYTPIINKYNPDFVDEIEAFLNRTGLYVPFVYISSIFMYIIRIQWIQNQIL